MTRFHRPGSYAFMDMLEAGNPPLTVTESKVQLALWAIMAQPFHLGNDIRNMSAQISSMFLNRDLIEAVKDPLVSMGRRVTMRNPSQRLGGQQVWSRELVDNSRLIAFVNANNATSTAQVCAKLTSVGLNPEATCRIRDVFAQGEAQHARQSGRELCVTVASRDVALLRVQQ